MAVTDRSCASCGGTLTKARQAKRKRKCYSCEVAGRRESKLRAHDRRVTMNGFTGEDYWRLYEAQGGKCAILNCRANGRTRFLSVDHDHKCGMGHSPASWCRSCVRGLCCSHHNTEIGRAGDNPEVFDSMAAYLRYPPARKVLDLQITHAITERAKERYGQALDRLSDM